DIGVMKAIGANIIQIVGVFLGQGIIVGLFGTLMGLGLGMTLVRYRNEFSQWLAGTFGIEVFPKQVYQFSRLPAEVIPRDVATICIGAFLICCVFAFLPAYRAAGLDPVNALRYE
ncbi:MAG: lipoprotein-releasing system permease protein, partial [Verrucomicrobiota bacterium]